MLFANHFQREQQKIRFIVFFISRTKYPLVDGSDLDIPNTHIHDLSPSWISTGTSRKSGAV
jgi:hypothetical protein